MANSGLNVASPELNMANSVQYNYSKGIPICTSATMGLTGLFIGHLWAK